MKSLFKSCLMQSISAIVPLLRQVRRRKLVLLYHEIFDQREQEDDARRSHCHPEMAVEVTVFARHLKWLSTFADFVTLDQIMEERVDSPGSRWQVAITFDDAYRNVFRLALPILEHYRAPAIVFVPVYYLEDQRRLPWWDLGAFIVSNLRDVIQVKYQGKLQVFDLRDAPGQQAFLNALSQHCYYATSEQMLAYQVAVELAVRDRLTLPHNQFARPDELAAATSSGLITYGSHGVHHINMAQASITQARHELARSAELITEWTGQGVSWFSYPYGKEEFRSPATGSLIRQLGFRGAVINNADYVTAAADFYEVPRLSVIGTWSTAAFRSWVVAVDFFNRMKAARPRRVPATAVEPATAEVAYLAPLGRSPEDRHE